MFDAIKWLVFLCLLDGCGIITTGAISSSLTVYQKAQYERTSKHNNKNSMYEHEHHKHISSHTTSSHS